MADAPVAVVRMRRTLDVPLARPAWPAGVRLVDFDARDAPEVHDLLVCAYAGGGDTVAPFAPWWEALAADPEFDPALCFVARDAAGRMDGVAQCWTSAFVKDLAVHPRRRRQGLGAALLLHACAVFRARGAAAVDLKVRADNLAARCLYERVGMRVVAGE